MFSYEISDIVKKYNYCIPSSVYIRIIQTSPQINHVLYNPYNDKFNMWDKDGTYWEYSVKSNI